MVVGGSLGRKSAARACLCALILCVLLSTALEGVHSGWYRWLPGSMSRHRDSVAVAITTVAYGKWQGYASYRKVNRVLRRVSGSAFRKKTFYGSVPPITST